MCFEKKKGKGGGNAAVEGGNFSKILETDGSPLKMVSTEGEKFFFLRGSRFFFFSPVVKTFLF